MKNLYALLILLTVAASSKAQTYAWTKTFGGTSLDYGYSVALDPSGNVFIGGIYTLDSIDFDPSSDTAFIHPFDGDDIFIAKYDQDGNYLWAHGFGESASDENLSMVVDQTGNLYITGYFNGTIDFDPSPAVANLTASSSAISMYVAKYDPDGNYVWAFVIQGVGPDEALGIESDGKGYIYLTGSFSGTADFDPSPSMASLTSLGLIDAFLAKYDTDGNYKWAFDMGGTSSQGGRSIAFDVLSNVYVTGFFNGTVDFDPSPATASLNSTSGGVVFIAKYDSLGNYIWAKNIGGNRSYGLEIDNANNILINGNYGPSGDFDPGPGTYTLTTIGGYDFFYAKYDSSGAFIWAKSIGGAGDDFAYDLKTDNISNIYITGDFKNTVDFDPSTGTASISASGTTYPDFFFVKYDSSGNFQWVKTAGNTGEDVGRSIALSPTGDFYLTGWFTNTVDFDPGSPIDNHSSNGMEDIFLTKYKNPTTTIEIIPKNDLESFKIYPNPANNTLFCETTQSIQLYIYNSSGALVFNQQLNTGKHALDISFFSPGIYLIRSNQRQSGTALIKQ